MTVTTRPAGAEDQGTIRRLVREARLNPMSLDWPHFILAEDGGEVVGAGQVKTHRDGSRELASILVVPPRQGEGIGSLLVRTLLEPHGDDVLHLTCRRPMQGYYARFGFSPVPRGELPRYFARLMPIVNVFARFAGAEIVVMRRDPVRSRG